MSEYKKRWRGTERMSLEDGQTMTGVVLQLQTIREIEELGRDDVGIDKSKKFSLLNIIRYVFYLRSTQ